MAPDDPTDDRKALEAITELDPATRAELERWFGLPSFAELEETQDATEHPDLVEARERRDKAIAAVDPVLLEEHRVRMSAAEDLIRFEVSIETHVEARLALIDLDRIDTGAIAEPRELEIPEPIRDDMKDCTPQAILRDLHRPETDFPKVFEVIDFAAEGRVDATSEVRSVMSTRWQPTAEDLGLQPGVEARAILRAIRAEQKEPWAPKVLAQELPNRRWTREEDR
jgi:hypothetical protein